MPYFYLEFEKILKPLDEIIQSLESNLHNLTVEEVQSLASKKMERKSIMENMFSNLTRWERIQLAWHPRRPFALDYINISPKIF